MKFCPSAVRSLLATLATVGPMAKGVFSEAVSGHLMLVIGLISATFAVSYFWLLLCKKIADPGGQEHMDHFDFH